MIKFLDNLLLFCGLYGLIFGCLLYINELLTMIFIVLCVLVAPVLLTIRRRQTSVWGQNFSSDHPNTAPLLKVIGAYCIYVLVSLAIKITRNLNNWAVEPETSAEQTISLMLVAAALSITALWRIYKTICVGRICQTISKKR